MNINPKIANTIEHHNKNATKKIHLYAIMLEPPHFDSLPYNILFYSMHDLIFTLDDSLSKFSFMDKYIKILYPQPSLSPIPNPTPFDKRKLLTLINSYKKSYPEAPTYYYDLYQKRIDLINYFNDKNCFDFYGRQWEDSSFKTYSSYKGKTSNKITTLQNYKFAICFENSCHTPGYITEKIFDALIAGVVPVYWGAPNIHYYIPFNCYIDMQKFKNYAELHTFLINMNETVYNSYIQSGKEFLQSAETQKFLNSNVAQEITRHIIKNLSL